MEYWVVYKDKSKEIKELTTLSPNVDGRVYRKYKLYPIVTDFRSLFKELYTNEMLDALGSFYIIPKVLPMSSPKPIKKKRSKGK